jgi:hypothetical protein
MCYLHIATTNIDWHATGFACLPSCAVRQAPLLFIVSPQLLTPAQPPCVSVHHFKLLSTRECIIHWRQSSARSRPVEQLMWAAVSSLCLSTAGRSHPQSIITLTGCWSEFVPRWPDRLGLRVSCATDGRTPWTSDQAVVRPQPAQDNTT